MRVSRAAAVQLPRPWSPFPATGTCKVLLAGTSITRGLYGDSSQDSQGGYRGPLFARCQRANARVDFVGSQSAAGQGAGSGHEGYGGLNAIGLSAFLAARLTTYTPHVIVIELGMNEEESAVGATAMATAILDLCYSTLPDSLVLVQNVIPTYPGSLHPNYNAQLAIEVANRRAAGRHIELVDENRQSRLVPGVVDFSEAVTWIHPSAVGYPKMAVPLFDHLARYL